MKRNVFLFLFTCSVAFSLPGGISNVKLIEHKGEKTIAVKTEHDLLANRFYTVDSTALKATITLKTDEYAEFPQPLQVYLPGTVVRGVQVGAKDLKKHFLFEVDGSLKETILKEQDVLLVLSNPPVYKKISQE